MKNISRNKLVFIALICIFAFVVIYFALTSINRSGKTAIQLSAFPEDINITINGTTIKTGTTYFTPGTYKIEAEKQGYDSYTKTVVLGEDEQTIAIILAPNSEEAFEYGRNNEAAYRKVQARGEIAAAEAGKLFDQMNPIVRHLPYKTFQYSIGYRMDQSDPSGNSIIIEIDAPDGYRQAALYRIRQLGYDPTDFTINFREYENPFSL